MLTRFFNGLFFLVAGSLLYSCNSARKVTRELPGNIGSIRFVNEFFLPHHFSFRETTVGGLSSIDYDPASGLFYMVCDDPSFYNPARFYTAKINISAAGIDTVILQDVKFIYDPKNEPYPNIRKDRIHSADLESMRYDRPRHQLIRGSEGQRIIRGGDSSEIQDPTLVIMDTNGRFRDTFELPANIHFSKEQKGPRHNTVFEGMSFNDDYSKLYVALENALMEDGPGAGTGDSTAWMRILEFDMATRKQTGQYAYLADPVPFPANPVGAFKINGVTDILNIGRKKFIIIERGYSTGKIESNVRVYLADSRRADNIAEVRSLPEQPVRSLKKRLLVNMDTLGRFIYNVEGVTLGPRMPNGNRTLIFVVDDNFNTRERTQFLLFEIIP